MISLCRKNLKEIVRDPLSFLLLLGFPLMMLGLMSLLNRALPPEANMEIFRIRQLTPGICVFSLSFCMLFGALTLSRDRSGALLWRLRAAPLRPVDFMLGYLLPLGLVGLLQCVVCLLAGQIIGWSTGDTLNHPFQCLLCLVPSVVLFVSLGIFFGGLLSEKAAPGLCSILISAASLLSGVWMDVDALGGGFQMLCRCLPFYHCVQAGRLCGSPDAIKPVLISGIWATAAFFLAISILKKQSTQDI